MYRKFIKRYWTLLAIFLLAAILRFVGLIPGFPPMHPDESLSYSTAVFMLKHAYKPDWFAYPSGMALINAAIFRSIFLPIQLFRLFIVNPEMIFSYLKLDTLSVSQGYDFLFGKREIYAMFWSRFIHATFGLATVMLLYFTVRRLFNKSIAILAAGFLAVNYRHVLGSHFGLPDILNSFFALLALLAAVLLIEKRTLKRYIFVGIAAGLSFSIKYQFFAFIPLLIAHFYWVAKTRASYIFHRYAWCALLVFIFTLIAINPYHFFNLREVTRFNDIDYRRYQMGVMYFRLYGYFYLFHWGIGELACVMIIIGAVIMAVKNSFKFLLISSFSFVFIAFMTYFSNGAIYPRNFVTLIPYLMIFAGFAVGNIYEWMKRFKLRHTGVLIGIMMIVVNFRPAYNSFILSINYAKSWNTNTLEQWLVNTMPENIKLRAYQLFANDLGRNAIKNKRVNFLSWDYSKGPNSLAEFQEEGTDFAILQLSSFQSITYWWRNFPKKSMYFQYNDVPYDYITNSFFGLTLREFLPYTVAEIYKPWQAAEEINYLIFKIPKRPQKEGPPVARFEKETISMWEPIDYWGLGKGNATFRISSKPFSVTPGKQYLISGLLKEDGGKTATHDGYLRVDFYKNREDYKKITMSLGVALSARVLPDGTWVKKEFVATVPKDAHFAAISFQHQLNNRVEISSVEVFEALDKPKETFPDIPYIPSTIQYKDIFYSSFL